MKISLPNNGIFDFEAKLVLLVHLRFLNWIYGFEGVGGAAIVVTRFFHSAGLVALS